MLRTVFQQALVVLAVLVGLWVSPVAAQSISGRALPAHGPDGAVVEIVEVADFQCPYCAKSQATLAQVAKAYPTQVRFTFIHQPLSFHDKALPAALASVAAQDAGKFWPFARALFAEQDKLSAKHTRAIAMRFGISKATVDAVMKNPDAIAFVQANRKVASAMGARGTPSYFVNGTPIRSAQPFARFKSIVDIELALAGTKAMTADAARAHRQKRIRTNNPGLHAYLYEGKAVEGVEVPAQLGAGAPGASAASDGEPVYKALIRDHDPVRGDAAKALVTMVAYVGYTCPYSRKQMLVFDDLQQTYGAELRLVLKQLPLPMHTMGEPSALAALCAHDQGKFWEMNAALFGDDRLVRASLGPKAAKVGLDMQAFNKCLTTGAHRARLAEEREHAQRIGARGTPITYINGRQLVGALPVAEFQTVIDAELIRARAKVAEGAAVEGLYDALMSGAQLLQPLGDATVRLDIVRSPTLGDRLHPVQLVVFSDYQCPYCVALEPQLKALYERYKGKLGVTIKHFPLSSHKAARPAAMAAYCAHKQGRFWPMHEALLASHATLSGSVIDGIARQVGLDMGTYGDCLEEPESSRHIDADRQEGVRAGLQGTPTLLFNGRRYDLSFGTSVESLSKVVDQLLAETP